MAGVRTELLKLIDKQKLEKIPCVICGGTEFKQLKKIDRYGFDLSVVVCKKCDLIQVNPRLPQEFYDIFYEKYYRDLHQIKERIGGLDEYFDWQYKRAEKLWPEAKTAKRSMFIFEIGCSAGGILQYFKDCGHKAEGIDLDKAYVEYGQSKGLDITLGTIDDVKFEKKPSYVIMSHVIEHLLEPDKVLKKVREIMHPRGWLYIDCPGVYNLLEYDMDFKRILQLAHVYYFSLGTLTKLLGKCGFHISQGTEKIQSVFQVTHDVPKKFQDSNGTSAAIMSDPKGQKAKRMITGHPRSGTMYMAHLLERMGIDMPHQEIGKDGTVSWQHIVNNEYKVECDCVIHQVRHPLKVIASTAYTFNKSGYPLMFDCIGQPPNPHPLAIAMWTWIGWNKLIEERAIGRFQIENFGISDITDMLGIEEVRTIGVILPKNINSIPHIDTSWAELGAIDIGLCNEVRALGVKYGYTLD